MVGELADAVAAAFGELVDLGAIDAPIVGVGMLVYWDGSDASHWVGETAAITVGKAEWAAAHGAPEDLFNLYDPPDMVVDLAVPDLHDDPALWALGEALLDHIEQHDADDLVEVYFTALGDRLHALWGVPVGYESYDGTRVDAPVQVRRQLSAEDAAAWEARGWLAPLDAPRPGEPARDVLLAVALPDGRQAGISVDGDHRIGTHDLSGRGGVGLDRPIVLLGDDPAIAAGALPEGAVAARVQDLRDAWHDAMTGHGVWLCVLPHAARGGTPPVVFTDAAGAEVALPEPEPKPRSGEPWTTFSVGASGGGEAQEPEPQPTDAEVLARARVPALWDDAFGAEPELRGWSGDDRADGLTLAHAEVEIETEDGGDWPIDDPEREALDLVEQRLAPLLGARPAGRRAIEAAVRPLPATIDGRPETFALADAGDLWVAVWVDPRSRLQVRAGGAGAAPARLDLRRR